MEPEISTSHPQKTISSNLRTDKNVNLPSHATANLSLRPEESINIASTSFPKKSFSPERNEGENVNYFKMQCRKNEINGKQNNAVVQNKNNQPVFSIKLTPQEEEYLKTLTEKEYKAYEIAKNCLGTSFNLEKSNGYLDYVTKLNTHSI